VAALKATRCNQDDAFRSILDQQYSNLLTEAFHASPAEAIGSADISGAIQFCQAVFGAADALFPATPLANLLKL